MSSFARQLRQNQTDAENCLWYFLREKRSDGHKFRRQKPIGPYIVDFCCVKEKLVIELDGSQHLDQAGYDRNRTNYLNDRGYRVIRFWDNDVLARTEMVLEEIWRALSPPSPCPLSPQTTWEERESNSI